MKTYLAILTISLSLVSAVNAQTMTVKAEGGEPKISWDSRAQEIQRSGDESQFLYGSGCTEGPSVAKESSSLVSQGKSTYGSKNLYDWDPRTAWVEGDSGYGIGHSKCIDLKLSRFIREQSGRMLPYPKLQIWDVALTQLLLCLPQTKW